KRIHLRGAAVHEQEDYISGLGLEVRRARTEGILRSGACSGAVSRVGEKRGQGHGAEAIGALPQHLAAGQRRCEVVMAMHGSWSVYENELLDVEQHVTQITPCLNIGALRRLPLALQEFQRLLQLLVVGRSAKCGQV